MRPVSPLLEECGFKPLPGVRDVKRFRSKETATGGVTMIHYTVTMSTGEVFKVDKSWTRLPTMRSEQDEVAMTELITAILDYYGP
jgi:hypothetical protein